jgi:cobalt-zinc-cadmium efflux system membrane fusion protein
VKNIYFRELQFALLISLLLSACSSGEREREREEKEHSHPLPAKTVVADGSIHLTPAQAKTNGIQTAAAIEKDVAAAITAIGRLRAQPGHEAEVSSPFSGRLTSVGPTFLRVGDFVRKGQVVAEVEQLLTASETAQFGAQIAQLESAAVQAQQEVDLRQTELNRSKQLYEGGAISLSQYQTAEFNLRQAQARLEAARTAKEKYESVVSQRDEGPRRIEIQAPISGTVLSANITAGQQIDTAKTLMTIVDLSTMWVEAAVHETELPSIGRARSCEISTPATPGRMFTGNLVTIGASVDPINRTVPVIFSVNNPDGSLKVGMTAEVRIPTGPSAKAVLIPASAVLYGEGQSVVYVESKPGIYQRRVVATGDRQGENITVRTGLNAGEKVVSVGAQVLQSEALKGQIPAESD